MRAAHREDPPQTSLPWPSARQAWWTVAGIVLAAFLCTMDKLVLNLLVDPIKADLRISDLQFSFLQGASFSVVNAVAAIPLGLMADRFSRRNLLMSGIAVWSLATLCGGLSTDYQQFTVARIFVGIGEAALWPVAVSLLADVLPPYWRGRAVGMVILGQIFGSGASLAATGFVLKLIQSGAFADYPALAHLTAWRTVLVLWALLGLVVIGVLLTIREPARRLSGRSSEDKGSLRVFLAHVRKHKALFIPIYFGAFISSLNIYGLAAWGPAFFMRQYNLSPGQIGPILGAVGIVGGIVSTMTGGFLSDREEKRKQPSRKLRISALATLACLPGGALIWAPTPTIAIALHVTSLLFGPIAGMVLIVAVQDLIPPRSRGLGMAILGVFTGMLGASLGPSVVALTTEYVFGSSSLVGYSLLVISTPALLIAAFCYWKARGESQRYFAAEAA